LRPVPIHREWLALEGLLHEPKDHHAVLPGLARPDGVEQPHDGDRDAALPCGGNPRNSSMILEAA